VFAFGLAQPISALASTATRNAIGIAVAVILLSFVTMITRRKAMSQVVGFLSMENGLFFGAMSATYGMPMIVEFGVALDVLVAVLVLGIFFFQIREQFDSLDLHHLESLKESRPLYEYSANETPSLDPTGSLEGATNALHGGPGEGPPGSVSRGAPAQEGATHALHGEPREGPPGSTVSGRMPAQKEGAHEYPGNEPLRR
jgi:hydrogenase-4 component E